MVERPWSESDAVWKLPRFVPVRLRLQDATGQPLLKGTWLSWKGPSAGETGKLRYGMNAPDGTLELPCGELEVWVSASAMVDTRSARARLYVPEEAPREPIVLEIDF